MSKRMVIFIVFLSLLLSAPFLLAVPVPNDPRNNLGVGAPGGEPGEEPEEDDQPPTAVDVALANPSFELGTDAPNNWTPLTGYVGDQYLWDTGTVSAGSRSVATHSTRWEYGRWSSDALDVEAGGFQWYALSGKVKTLENNGEVYLSIAWLDADGKMIATSDSAMLPEGDNDWTTVTVSALPAAGAMKLSVWCVSNHNAGLTWFDALELTRTAFATQNAVSYAQFLIDQPTHPLAIEANLMQVQELMTKAKWAKEADFYGTEAQLSASLLYAQAAGITRADAVFAKVFAALHEDAEKRAKALAAVKARFDGLIDEALLGAYEMAEAGGNKEKADGYRTKLTERGVLNTADPLAD